MRINKSNFLFLNAFVFIIFLFAQCTKKEDPKPKPTANFSIIGNNQIALSLVSFSNLSINASSYVWDFGDGGTSTEENPQHSYQKAGIFTIKLTATGDGGSNSTTQSITISAIDVKADFYVSGNYKNAPVEVTFNNLSQNGDSYKWEFGDGGTSTEKDPIYNYIKGGTFTVKLTITAKDGSSISKSESIIIKEKPLSALANFSVNGENNYAPSKINFSNDSKNAISYVWDFGDGSNPSSETNPTHIYKKGGTYNVILYALNIEGKENSISKNVIVKNAPTKLKINKLNILKLPFTDDKGNSWDNSNGADVYFKIASTNLTTTVFQTTTINNLTLNMIPGSMGSTYGFPHTLSLLDYKYSLVFYDEDTIDADDFIGGYYLTIKDYMPTDGSSYPSIISYGTSSSTIQIQLEVEWLP